jgi:hypothetical protein
MGMDPIKDVVLRSAGQELPELSASIRKAALNFGQQSDDQTMLIIRHL